MITLAYRPIEPFNWVRRYSCNLEVAWSILHEKILGYETLSYEGFFDYFNQYNLG